MKMMIIMKFKEPVPIDENSVTDSTNISLPINSTNIKNILGQSKDVVFREIYINGDKDLTVTLAFINGLVSSSVVNDDVLKPLLQECKLNLAGNCQDIIDLIEHGVIYTSTVKVIDNTSELIDDILSGFSTLIFSPFSCLCNRGFGILRAFNSRVIPLIPAPFLYCSKISTITCAASGSMISEFLCSGSF
jgi:hypothetical protein